MSDGVAVLFVDDEEDIRFSFAERFEDRFAVHLAQNGREALEKIRHDGGIHVVVTDIRMPGMDGLELIREGRSFNPELGFIIVSGHGDSDEVIEALKLGARSYLRKPYRFDELEQTIVDEANRYRMLIEERKYREAERESDRFLVAVERICYRIPSRMDWLNVIAFRLVRVMEALGVCDADTGTNVALGIVEILNNAVEHGNLGITGEEKLRLKSQGDTAYHTELRKREVMPPYRDRHVEIEASIDVKRAMIRIVDEGPGFDYAGLPDPTRPENLFAPSGRGILLARTFLDEVLFTGRGNEVTLIKYAQQPETDAGRSTH